MSPAFPASELTAWVDEHSERLIEEWRACCRIRSVSADGPAAVGEMAAWLTERASALFDQFESLEAPGSAPVLLGTLRGDGPGRLLIYSHYDVVPPGEGWAKEPFGAERSDEAVYARGAGDDKADVMARLHALEAWIAVRGRLPFTVLWLSEGMEEVGSPGLREVIVEHRDALHADACLWESYYRSIDGRAATIGFGCRGVLNVELSVRLLESDTHSSMAGIYRSAAMILARAISSLVDEHGRVRVSGFYDDVLGLSDEDLTVVARSPAPSLGSGTVDSSALWTGDPGDLTRRWLYEPTLNVASLHSGPDAGEHEATVLPAAARARIDIRLMPDQDPHRIFALLGAHLRAEGVPEVDLRLCNAVPPARSPLDSPLAAAVRQASTELFSGAQPLLHRVVPGSGPLHLFTTAMPIAAVMPPGTIRPDSGMHGPDENARVEDYLDEVALTLRIFELLADSDQFESAEETA